MIKLPKTQFSRWVEISQRMELEEFNKKRLPGLYIVSSKKSSYKSNSPAKVLDKDIIYIGMTTTSIKGRVDKFYRRVRGLKGSHSGGKRILSKFKKYPNSTKWKNRKIFIAVSCRFEKNEPKITYKDFIKMGKISYIEYYLFARYFKKFKRLPIGNKENYNEIPWQK